MLQGVRADPTTKKGVLIHHQLPASSFHRQSKDSTMFVTMVVEDP